MDQMTLETLLRARWMGRAMARWMVARLARRDADDDHEDFHKAMMAAWRITMRDIAREVRRMQVYGMPRAAAFQFGDEIKETLEHELLEAGAKAMAAEERAAELEFMAPFAALPAPSLALH